VRKVIILFFILIFGFPFIACDNGTGGGTNGGNWQKTPETPSTPLTPQPFNNITASQLVSNIKIGWNLGNSLDSANLHHKGSNLTVNQLEKGWDDIPVATKALIDTVKEAGFNAIRIPVTWSKAANSNYNIRLDWMIRITEVVNYAAGNGMYIILNTHHDDMDTSINNEVLFQFTNAGVNQSLSAFRKIWEQIANNFKNYNEKLIFEALNEPRTKGSPNEWTGGTAEERNNLNKHYEVFIDVVRNSGGNNDKRILMINTYAASTSQAALDGLVLPTDTISNKLIVSVHEYSPYNFALNSWNIGENGSVDTWDINNSDDKLAITEPIDRVYEKFVSKGIPVIMGEFGSVNKNNLAARAAHAEFYVSYAKSKEVRCFWWDSGLSVPLLGVDHGNFGIINRSNNQWTHPQIVEALMRGAESENLPLGPGTDAVFTNWIPSSDGASSITHTVPAAGRQRIQGTLTGSEGYANIFAAPDSASLERMKTMNAITFMATGDGKQYSVMIPTTETNIEYNHYRFTFTASSSPTQITVYVPSNLAQADWGGAGVTAFNQSNVQGFAFQPFNNGSFDLTVWDVKLYN